MRKFAIPILILSIFTLATPVYAFSFGDFLGFFGIARPTPVASPSTNFGGFVSDTVRPIPPQGRFVGTTQDQGRQRPTSTPGQPGFDNGVRTQPQTGSTVTPGAQGVSTRAVKLQALVTRMLNSFQNRIDNYTDFLTKVKTRRDKLAADGQDVTKLDSFIATATTNLAAAQAALSTAKSALAGLDYTANPGTVIQTVRDQLKLVRDAMTTLHKSMSQTVAGILGLSANVTPKPTKNEPQTTIEPGNRFGQNDNPGQGRGRGK